MTEVVDIKAGLRNVLERIAIVSKNRTEQKVIRILENSYQSIIMSNFVHRMFDLLL
jgi:hypothetical protein